MSWFRNLSTVGRVELSELSNKRLHIVYDPDASSLDSLMNTTINTDIGKREERHLL